MKRLDHETIQCTHHVEKNCIHVGLHYLRLCMLETYNL